VSIPLVDGIYPVTPLIEALGFQLIRSVARTPVAVAELTEPAVTVWHDPEVIAEVAREIVPLATVTVML
jgi:hypothetical protein